MQNFKTPRKNIEENLDNLVFGDDFLDIIPNAKSMKKIKDKLDLINLNVTTLQKVLSKN